MRKKLHKEQQIKASGKMEQFHQDQLSDSDLAFMAVTLEAPIVFQDMLGDKKAKLCDESIYGLHSMISDMQPDSALLSIALCARQLAFNHAHKGPALKILAMQAERIITDYAPLWLRHARGGKLSREETLLVLSTIPEDMEEMAELLDIARMGIGRSAPAHGTLCKLLKVQAESHGAIAEEFLSVLEQNIQVSRDHAPLQNNNILDLQISRITRGLGNAAKDYGVPVIIRTGNNVLAFPER